MAKSFNLIKTKQCSGQVIQFNKGESNQPVLAPSIYPIINPFQSARLYIDASKLIIRGAAGKELILSLLSASFCMKKQINNFVLKVL